MLIMHAHIHTHAHAHTLTHTRVRVRTHTRTHTRTRTHAHTHTHTNPHLTHTFENVGKPDAGTTAVVQEVITILQDFNHQTEVVRAAKSLSK